MDAEGNKTGGRKKGSLNKTTLEVKAALEEAFDKRGGVEALIAWSMESPDEFYKLWAKLLPKDVTVTGGNGEPLIIQVITSVPDAAKEPDANG